MMEYLFSENGLAHLHRVCCISPFFAFDYDGTLTGIVERPENAFLPASTSQLLSEIRDRATVAIISGRSQRDVAGFIDGHTDYIVGNHGLEGLPGIDGILSRAHECCEIWLKTLPQLLDSMSQYVAIENKLYSLSLHYRNAPNDKNLVRRMLIELSQTLHPLPRIVTGKDVVNLVSPEAPNKGTALEMLMRHMNVPYACYVGDDDTDEDVFNLHTDRIVSIRVGRSTNSNARFYIQSQQEIDRLLETVLSYLQRNACSELPVYQPKATRA